MNRYTLAISAVNFFEGGPLSVLKDCLKYLNDQKDYADLKVLALVHQKSLFDEKEFPNIEFIEFPKSRQSYFYRLYYEYFHFKVIAKKYNVSFWLSLHDITPNVGEIPQAVYCHNPSPFNTINYSDIYIQPTQFFFKLFYKYLYRINIKKNKYVIVQQLWMKKEFSRMFDLDLSKIIVAKPQVQQAVIESNEHHKSEDKLFFYPAFPRPFKNIEVIGKAVEILEKNGIAGFKVVLTIDGTENKYAAQVVEKFKSLSSIKFVGLLSRDEVFSYYNASDCLLFPSKLETWGLPISEFKQYGKSMILSNLSYAKETGGDYEKIYFFNPQSATELANYMAMIIEEASGYHATEATVYPSPYAENWNELFKVLLN